MQYRREIDGLRAVAVLPVILFHGGFGIFSGGFVGVDVFFVISGYLITAILLADLARGEFSLLGFYERRARRILPALTVVVAACVPVAFVLMLPHQFRDFAGSVVAVALFVSNVLFWQETGYFAPAAELKPLLHTWSLAVEEQFYLVFPLVLWAAWRFGRTPAFLVVIAAAAGSLALAEIGTRLKPEASFYLAPTRVWELLAGSACAFLHQRRPRAPNGWLAGLGLVLVCAAILLFDETTRAPGIALVVPVVGTMLVVLYAGEETLAGRLLSLRPLVAVGLVSYSAYLWHQPLFAFARIASLEPPADAVMLALAAASLVLAAITWRWVEQPFRGRPARRLSTRKAAFAATIAAITATAAVGAASTRLPALAEIREPDLFREDDSEAARSASCEGFDEVRFGSATCAVYGSGRRSVLVWGDSHAGALARGIRPSPDVSVTVLTHDGCPPAPGARRLDVDVTSVNCRDGDVLARYLDWLAGKDFEATFLVARWTIYLRGWHVRDRLQAAAHFLADGETAGGDPTSSADVLARSLARVAKVLGRSGTVTLVTQPPDVQALGENARHRLLEVDAAPLRAWHAVEHDLAARVGEMARIEVLDTLPLFCDDATCGLRRDGRPIHYDDNHLTATTARLQWEMIERALATTLARPAITP